MAVSTTGSHFMRVLWLVSVAWMILLLLAQSYLFVRWLLDFADPLRYERAVAAGLLTMYSTPAAVGILVSVLNPRAILTKRERTLTILLLLMVMAFLLLFDKLQSTYR